DADGGGPAPAAAGLERVLIALVLSRSERGSQAMRTEICDRLGIEFPIFAFTHCRDVAAAVTNAGGLGVLGAVGFSAEQLEVELAWLDEHVGDRPYGVDL